MPNTDNTSWKALARVISGQASCLEEFADEEILKQAGRHGVDLLLYPKYRREPLPAWGQTPVRFR